MKNYMNWSRNHPAVVILIITLLTVVALHFARRINIETSVQGMVATDSPSARRYHETTAAFGSERVVTVFVRDPLLFTPPQLALLEEIAYQLEGVAGVDRCESIFSADAIADMGGRLSVGPLVEWLPESGEEAAALLARVRRNPLVQNRLVSADGTAMAINLYFTPLPSAPRFYEDFVDAVEAVITPAAPRFETIFQIGNPYLRKIVGDHLVKDQIRLSLLSLAALILLLAITTRSVSGALLPTLSSGISIVWTLGFMGAAGIPVNILTIIIPSLIIAIGSTEDTHLLTEYISGMQQHGGDRPLAVQFMIAHMGIVILFTALTTFLGFLSICVNSIVILRQFGLAAAFGMLVNPILTATIVPLYLEHCGPRPRLSPRREKGGTAPSCRIDIFAGRLTRVIVNQRHWIFSGMAILLLLLSLAASTVQLNNDIAGVFKERSPVKTRLATIEKYLPGVQTFYLVIDGGHPGVFKEPQHLRQIEALQQFIENHPQFDTSLSLVDYLKLIHREMNGGDEAADRLPDTIERTGQYLMLLDDYRVSRLVSSDFRKILVSVRHHMHASHQQKRALTEIDTYLHQHLNAFFQYHLTGELILFMEAADDIAFGQVASICLILIIIFIIMSVLFVNVKAGLISLLPNLFPVAVGFGLMGLFEIPLNIGTAMVAAIAIGIAVDDTIHFMTRYNQEMMAVKNQKEAMVRCIRSEIRPILVTSTALACAFGIYLFSEFVTINQFGFLSAAVILSAMAVDLTLTPSLLCSTKLLTLWDILTLHVRREIVEQSEFFRDLKSSQIKRIILMGRIRNVSRGKRSIGSGIAATVCT
jgi:predicted RND superfamily exporter protein